MPEAIYKYVTANGLINILKTRKLKWSAPKTFNDPFDLQINAFKYDLNEFRRIAEEKVRRIIFDEESPSDKTPQEILTLRRRRINDPSVNLENEIKGLCDDWLETEREIHDELVSKIDSRLEEARVLCLTETYRDILMWGHYTDSHSGGVIRFQCEYDRIINYEGALKVLYEEERPDSNFISEVIDYTLKINEAEPDAYRFLCTKSNHWEYEKEWRLIAKAANEEGMEFHDFSPDELEGIYLGCRMSQKDREIILNLLGNEFRHVKVFQASTNSKMYELDFSQIK